MNLVVLRCAPRVAFANRPWLGQRWGSGLRGSRGKRRGQFASAPPSIPKFLAAGPNAEGHGEAGPGGAGGKAGIRLSPVASLRSLACSMACSVAVGPAQLILATPATQTASAITSPALGAVDLDLGLAASVCPLMTSISPGSLGDAMGTAAAVGSARSRFHHSWRRCPR